MTARPATEPRDKPRGELRKRLAQRKLLDRTRFVPMENLADRAPPVSTMRREPLGEVPSPTAQARAAQHRLFQRISQQTPRRATHPLRRCIQLFRCRPHRIARIVQQSNRLHCTAQSHLAAIVADVTEPVEVTDMRGRRRHLRENVAHEGREPRGTFGDVRGQIALMKIESAARRSSVLGGGPSARRCANLAFEAGQPLFLRPRWRRHKS